MVTFILMHIAHSAQAELKALLANKTKVIKETELRKSSLEQLEKQLDEFIAVSGFHWTAHHSLWR